MLACAPQPRKEQAADVSSSQPSKLDDSKPPLATASQPSSQKPSEEQKDTLPESSRPRRKIPLLQDSEPSKLLKPSPSLPTPAVSSEGEALVESGGSEADPSLQEGLHKPAEVAPASKPLSDLPSGVVPPDTSQPSATSSSAQQPIPKLVEPPPVQDGQLLEPLPNSSQPSGEVPLSQSSASSEPDAELESRPV